ncbi:MAG: 2-isopropylmalate synthase [Bdellovibrionota bacterium]|nr:2-isopropylmalate synthase [Bdellovibrionota bacterium]
MTNDRIIFFDTTLRDGEQSLTSSLSTEDKVQIATALENLGVDVIEAGFPVSSAEDFRSVREIGKTLKSTVPCALARALPIDIESCVQAFQNVERFRIHTFLATSEIHVKSKLRTNWNNVLDRAKKAVKMARKWTDDVEFSCEDAGRTSLKNLVEIIEAVIKEGATTINLPDTVGYCTPEEFGSMFKFVVENTKGIHKVVLSTHCHNDLGLAVSNTLSGINFGARQVECTINGLGERSGNCSLEEIAAIMYTRKDRFPFKNNIKMDKIYNTSQLVSRICNIPIQPNKAVVGENSFSHSSGIHQDGILKDRSTYEILGPEVIGLPGHKMFMTPRSGKHVIQHQLKKLGHQESSYNLPKFYEKFSKLADKQGHVHDYDLEALFWLGHEGEEFYPLSDLTVSCGTNKISVAQVSLKSCEHKYQTSASGLGPIDASFKAIKKVVNKNIVLTDYKITSKGKGCDSTGQIDISILFNGKTYFGKAIGEDIVEASCRAFIQAINNGHRDEKVQMKKIENEIKDRECFI